MEQQIIKKNESSFPSLTQLAAKAYAQQYKKLPDNPIPDECLDPIKLYLPVTLDSVVEQYALSLKFNDEKRKIECFDYLIKSNTSFTDSFFTFIELQLSDCSKIEFYNKYYKKYKINLNKQLKKLNLSLDSNDEFLCKKRLKKQYNNQLSKYYDCYTLFALAMAILPGLTLLCY